MGLAHNKSNINNQKPKKLLSLQEGKLGCRTVDCPHSLSSTSHHPRYSYFLFLSTSHIQSLFSLIYLSNNPETFFFNDNKRQLTSIPLNDNKRCTIAHVFLSLFCLFCIKLYLDVVGFTSIHICWARLE